MAIHYDEKGKFFTDVISKDPVPAIIQTQRGRLIGNVFVRRGERLIDQLLASGQFMAVTQATVYNDSGDAEFEAEFVSVNKDHIIWILPQNEAHPLKTEQAQA